MSESTDNVVAFRDGLHIPNAKTVHEDLVDELKMLLARAECGDICGLTYVVTYDDLAVSENSIGASDFYRTLGALDMLMMTIRMDILEEKLKDTL